MVHSLGEAGVQKQGIAWLPVLSAEDIFFQLSDSQILRAMIPIMVSYTEGYHRSGTCQSALHV